MATIMSHAVVAVAIGSVFSPVRMPRSLWVAGAFCAMLPDADVFGMALGVEYEDFWGHRGFTHSLLFAAIAALALTFAVFVRRPNKGFIAAYLFLATASHSVLDALTNGVLGVAFFSPIADTRYFFPFTPLEVCEIGPGFFSAESLPVVWSELLWLWLPSAVVIGLSTWWHRRRCQKASVGETRGEAAPPS